LAARAAGLTDPDDVVDLHIRRTVDQLQERSRLLAERVADGRVAVVGLSYRLADGTARVVVGPDEATGP
jgi:carbonic anhydrase